MSRQSDSLGRAIGLVTSERVRQIELGYDRTHDDRNTIDDLIQASRFYSTLAKWNNMGCMSNSPAVVAYAELEWPENWDRKFFVSALECSDAERNLTKAAALMVAALERLDRS